MKRLTQLFRENFTNFKYDEDSIDVLINLLDTIIEMLTIADFTDSIVYIKKLSSFLKLVSADYCKDILDLEVVNNIYHTQILPILNYLDKKYDPTSSKQSIETALKMINIQKSKNPFITNDENIKIENLDEESYNNLISFYNTKFKSDNDDINDKLSPEYMRGYDNKTLFTLLKSVSEQIVRIYNSYMTGDYDKDSVLRHLQGVKFSTGITKNHNHQSVRWISQSLYGLCQILISLIDSENIPILSTSNNLKLHFEFIDGLKYVEKS